MSASPADDAGDETLHVGLNVLHLVPGETGGSELYARRLVPALLRASKEVRLTLFASREGAPSLAREPWAGEAAVVRLPVRGRSRAARVAAEQALLPAAAMRRGIDLVHNVFSTAPVLPAVPQVTTILDVIYKRYPATHAGVRARGMALLVPLAARRSQRVIAISYAARDDLVELLGIDARRIDVTPLAPALPLPASPPDAKALRRRFGLGEAPVLLTVSAKRPHKNLERLIRAVAALDSAPSPVLVVPGYATAFADDLEELARELGTSERVRFTGWLDDETLDGLYRIADCFVFPSLAEGFGLPVLEAMVRGTPVACSNASSLPEVAGDAALYFDPTDVADIASAIRRLLADANLRRELSAAGRRRAELFTWEETARRTLASYARALGSTA